MVGAYRDLCNFKVLVATDNSAIHACTNIYLCPGDIPRPSKMSFHYMSTHYV